MRLSTYKTLNKSDNEPLKGSIITDKDCTIVKQVSDDEASVFFTDENGKVLGLKEPSMKITPEIAVKIMNMLLMGNFRKVDTSGLRGIDIEQPDGTFLKVYSRKQIYVEAGNVKYKFDKNGFIYYNQDVINIIRINKDQAYTYYVNLNADERNKYFIGGFNEATFESFSDYEEYSSDITVEIDNRATMRDFEKTVNFTYGFFNADSSSNALGYEYHQSYIKRIPFNYSSSFVLPKRVLKDSEKFNFKVELERSLSMRVKIELYKDEVEDSNLLIPDSSRLNTVSVPKDTTKVIVVLKNNF